MLFMKGAPETVLPRCSHGDLGAGLQLLTVAARERIRELQEKMANNGLRVLAFAHRELPERISTC